MTAAPWLLASYFLGAVPTSYLAARLARGIDLRRVGSGNLGATNLYRTLGWGFAIPVGLFDIAKGAVPVLVFGPRAGTGVLPALLCGGAAVIGHVYSVFVGFKGGKGVATGAGVVLAIAPWAFLVALGVWLAVLRLTGYVSLASMRRRPRCPLPPGDFTPSDARPSGCSGTGGVRDRAPPRQRPPVVQRDRAPVRSRAPSEGGGGGMTDVAVLGAGSWGTTLADLLARNGHTVRLWAYEAEVAEAVASRRENPLYLPGRRLAPGLRATADVVTAVRGAPHVVL